MRERVSEWVGEREREGVGGKERQTDRQTDRQIDRQTETKTDRQTETETETERANSTRDSLFASFTAAAGRRGRRMRVAVGPSQKTFPNLPACQLCASHT